MLATAAALLGLGLMATAGSGNKGKGKGTAARVMLKSADGRAVAKVKLRERRNGKVAVNVRARGLKPGFHGFHVHEKGLCESPGFTSAGGHHKQGDQGHGEHAGDMPPLLVGDDGKAKAAFVTDSFRIADLVAGDGSAIMIHVGQDNLANIPDRYHAHVPDASSTTFGPDTDTLKTGDAGDRFACGVVQARRR
jgi:Cu-Zn family superoxide dismutase